MYLRTRRELSQSALCKCTQTHPLAVSECRAGGGDAETEKTAEELFLELDEDESGYLDRLEVGKMLSKLGTPCMTEI